MTIKGFKLRAIGKHPEAHDNSYIETVVPDDCVAVILWRDTRKPMVMKIVTDELLRDQAPYLAKAILDL